MLARAIAAEHPLRDNPRNFLEWVYRTKPVCPEPRVVMCGTLRRPHLRAHLSTGIECVYRGQMSKAPTVDPHDNPHIL